MRYIYIDSVVMKVFGHVWPQELAEIRASGLPYLCTKAWASTLGAIPVEITRSVPCACSNPELQIETGCIPCSISRHIQEDSHKTMSSFFGQL